MSDKEQVKTEETPPENGNAPPAQKHGFQGRRGGGRFGGGGGRDGGGGGGGGDRGDRHQQQRRGFGGPKNNENRNPEDRIYERLLAMSGPTFELPQLDMSEKKFSGRNRLYIGNLPNDVTDEEVNQLFGAFGEVSDLFINKEKNFGFIKLDYHANAEKAKRELDGTIQKGRPLRIRFASNVATVKVKNLSTWVSNELLHATFSVFGEIERCVIIVDDRGKSTGEGIVEYARKPGATAALKYCSEGCLFLTSSLRPVIVENYDQMDTIDGYPEKSLSKKTPEYHQAREIGPRFAKPGTFEYEYGTRWKQLHELYKQKGEALKQELSSEEDKLEAQMQFAKFEYETEMLRDQLRQREMERERQKRDWEERERLAEEKRVRNEEQMRRQRDEIQLRMQHQEEDLRRRQQENNLFMQAHQLSSMLDQEEQGLESFESPKVNEFDENQSPMDPKQFMNNYDRKQRFDGGHGRDNMQGGSGGRGGHWGHDNRRDDYQHKRRRY